MTHAWQEASIKSFEHVPVAEATGLLRVSARSRAHAADGDPRPTLVADDGHGVTRFGAIPAPTDTDGILRAAYPVSSALVAPETVFSLELTDGVAIVLPDPTPGAARLAQGADAAPVAPEDERREELPAKLIELSTELGLARAEAAQLREPGQAGGGARADSQVLRLHLEAAETRAELEALRDLAALAPAVEANGPDRADLEERLAEATTRAESAVLELAGERERVGELRARTARAEAGHHQASARLSDLETWTAELERRLADTTTQLSEARTAAAAGFVSVEKPEPRHPAGEDELEEIRRAATAAAHDRAERDLAEQSSPEHP